MADDSGWVLECAMAFLRSPEYTTPVMNFIDENCIVFDTEDESKLNFTEVHQKFIAVVFELLESFLEEIGVTQEEFAAECDKAMAKGGDSAFVYHQIMAVEDFVSFKRMMVKRNRELELELLRELQQQQQQAGVDMGDAANTTGNTSISSAEGGDDLEAQEQRELEAALRLSRETFEQASVSRDGAGGAPDDDEARQLEEAIRLSRMEHEAQFQEDIPTSQNAEEEMLAKALAESLKNTQAEPAGAPPAPATLPPRKKEAPPPPPPRDPPPPEVLEQAKAIEPVTSSHVKALEVKHEIAVVEHALAVKAALAADIEDDSDDEDFELQSGPAASRPAAPPSSSSSSSASLPPPSPLGETASTPLSPVDTPPPAAKPPAPEAAAPAPAADPTPSSSSLPSLPDVKRPPTSSLPAIGGGSSKNVQLAGLSVEEMEKIEKKEQRKKDKERRKREQAALERKQKSLQEAASALESEDMDPAEVAKRKEHLQEQRRRLLEAKKKEREEALERELSSKAAGGGIAAAALNKRAIGGEIVAAIREADGASEHSVPDELAGLSEAERKRAELRRALSQRIKEDLSAMA